ncbi:MAG: peptidoglycan-binding protein [Cellulosilyticaceae bacterium]
MEKLRGKDLAKFVLTKIGTPYVYGAKGADGIFTLARLNVLAASYGNIFTSSYMVKAKKLVGKICCDCSGLPSWFTKKVLGSYQLCSSATKRVTIDKITQAPVGAILWKTGHVGVYIGDGFCVEAKGIDYGTVKSKVSDTHFTHWLLFEDYMEYDLPTDKIEHTKKGKNPYATPAAAVEFGDLGTSVRWVQWELNEAGIATKIDGEYGSKTEKNVKIFQESCKLKQDGVVGPITRKAFILD